MKWLLFGGRGWIAGRVRKFLEMYGEEVIVCGNHFAQLETLRQYIASVNPDRIVCAVGRTYGEGFTTIDYLEQKGKLVENLDSNLVMPVWIAQSFQKPILYFGTGCIYEYDENHTEENLIGFTEEEEPNFTGSSYSTVKRATDMLMSGFSHVLNARIRMPITLDSSPRDFVTKIMNYSKITSIRNSMTVLEDVLPRLLAIFYEGNELGTYNAVNPEAMTHYEILTLFKRDPSTYTIENLEDQNKRLLSKRSNNILDCTKLLRSCQQLAQRTKNKFSVREPIPTLKESLQKIAKFRQGNVNILLVTGGLGFIASNFINKWMVDNPDDILINVDRIDKCSNRENIRNKYPLRYFEYQVDIQDTKRMREILEQHSVHYVFHFAAETHVDNSFGNSLSFTKSNVLGTHSLLEACREHKKLVCFYHMSTDEVYGEIKDGAFHEGSLLMPTNPYAATKAAAEQIVYSYGFSFKVPYIILRANNIYGIQQYPEKVIPAFITRLLSGKKLQVQGDGSAKRMFLHVDDLVDAIQCIFKKGKIGEIYNIGTTEEYSVLQIAQLLYRKIKNSDANDTTKYIEYVPDRLFNDCRYSVDTTKLQSLGWTQKRNLTSTIDQIIHWYAFNMTYWT